MFDIRHVDDFEDLPVDSSVGSTGWAEPTVVLSDPTGGGDDPTLTGDMLELYFNDNSDIYVTTRDDIGLPWSMPSKVDELDIGKETGPELSPDGLTIYFGSDVGDASGVDVYVAIRSDRGAAWSTPMKVNELSSDDDDAGGQPALDGTQITVIRPSPSAGDGDVLISTRTNPGPWLAPVPLVEVNSTADDEEAQLLPDGLSMYFASNRVPEKLNDIYVATRSGTTGAFEVHRVDEVSSVADEGDPWVDPTGKHMFFIRDIGGGNVLFETSRP